MLMGEGFFGGHVRHEMIKQVKLLIRFDVRTLEDCLLDGQAWVGTINGVA
jgi:hypothetical protein